MFRLRYAVAAVVLATSGVGCAVFWDDAHEFPIPGKFAAVPGSYTGPPLQGDAQYRAVMSYGSPARAVAPPTDASPSADAAIPAASGASVPPPPPFTDSAAPATPPDN